MKVNLTHIIGGIISEFSASANQEYPLERLVSDENIERWTTIYDEQAHNWLAKLPMLVSECAEKWDLVIDEQLSGGTVSVVIGAKQNDEPVVLKIHPPWVPLSATDGKKTSAETEAAAFKIWDGEGAPKLLASDSQALVLERVVPAQHPLEITAQELATLITHTGRTINIGYATQLGIPLIDGEIAKRCRRADDRRPEQISYSLLGVACSIAACLCISSPAASGGVEEWELIHGDLRAKNVLQKSDGSFLAIDPSPAVGSRLYDAALWAIDKPEGIIERCEEVSDCLGTNPQLVGSMAIALSIPEICLASPARAEATLGYIKDFAETDDLEDYFINRFMSDNFMERYVVLRNE